MMRAPINPHRVRFHGAMHPARALPMPKIPRHGPVVIAVGGSRLARLTRLWAWQCRVCRWPRCFAALLIVLAVLLLAGCGGGDPAPEPRLPTPGVDCNARPALCV